MKKQGVIKPSKSQGRIGFIAFYEGKEIASSESFEKLTNNAVVKNLLGNENLVIKHTVPEDVVAIYLYTLS